MPDDAPHPDGLLAQRLDRLFRTVHPEDRKPFTPANVADAINAAAGERVTSGTYLWQLRTGRRDNPTYKVITGLSQFFGVPPTYFFDDGTALPTDVVTALADDAVRDIALRAAGLSDHSLAVIAQTVSMARERDEAQRRTANRRRRRDQAAD